MDAETIRRLKREISETEAENKRLKARLLGPQDPPVRYYPLPNENWKTPRPPWHEPPQPLQQPTQQSPAAQATNSYMDDLRLMVREFERALSELKEKIG